MKKSNMKQPHTDYGTYGETGEREPKGVKSRDSTGEKHVGTSKPDKEKFQHGASGEKIPAKSKGRDSSGEKHEHIVGGVGMGKADDCGRQHVGKQDGKHGEYNDGKKEQNVYSHKRSGY